MQLDLDYGETRALLNLLVETIEADRYPLSPRIRVLRDILAKFGEMPGTTTGSTADTRGTRGAGPTYGTAAALRAAGIDPAPRGALIRL